MWSLKSEKVSLGEIGARGKTQEAGGEGGRKSIRSVSYKVCVRMPQ